MNRHSSLFSTPRGQSLRYRTWEQSSRSYRRVLLLVHGFGYHSGSYPDLVQALVEDAYKVYALDLEGFGASPGERGDPADLNACVDDVETFRRMIAGAEGYREVLVLGHSLGALLVLAHAARYPGMGLRTIPASLPLSSPLYSAAGSTALTTVPFDKFTADGAVSAAAGKDPLCAPALSGRLLAQCRAMAESVSTAPKALAGRKLLFLHGDDDAVADPAAVEGFAGGLEAKVTELRTFPRMGHDPFAERRKENVFSALRDWVGKTEFEHKAP
jgi:alpha-beta hydrolase superfamily lysophospholipase